MSDSIITTSFEETQKIAIDFSAKVKGGDVLALHGDLGSGKTTFVQGLAKGLGIKQRIISPTFIIMRTYAVSTSEKKSASDQHFYHVDLYRIEGEGDIDGLGLAELMGDPENIVVIEWPEKIQHLLPEKRTDIFFEYLGDDKREIRFN